MTPLIHTTPLREVPAWAVLERRLFDEIETAWRAFSKRYGGPDGRLPYTRGFDSRDGVDDLYEPFFNWPSFYALGGSDEILAAAKHHWNGVTAQLSEAGMLTDEYESGYDWFHQGESLLFFYALCAADPADAEFAERARRFGELYTDPARGNYDPARNLIRAPHNGARGPLPGLGAEWQTYSADQPEMRRYGLPLEYLPGITCWDDLEDPANAHLMGQEMQRRAAGDVAVNLAATSLATNRWLYDGDEASAAWVLRYVDGWRARAGATGGLLPDNVGPDGTVGGFHDGRWFGGHYGWTWPHGLATVGMGALIGGINASFISGDDSYLDLARNILDTVLDEAITASVEETPYSLQGGWLARLGEDAATPMMLVPHRFGRDGWFDFGPMPLDLATWLWWWSRDPDDWQRLRRIIAGFPGTPDAVLPFRSKTEAGHEAPWIGFLAGEQPDYPVRALSMALGQVARRVAIMETEHHDASDVHLHFWQRVNPVVTEVLGQLISGTPQVLYNGGLPFAAVAYEDADRHRPGLPPDVAALVTRLDGDRIELELVNLSSVHPRRVIVRPSRFGEREIVAVSSRGERGGTYPGLATAYASTPGTTFIETSDVAAPEVLVELPPSHRAELVLFTSAAERRPGHHGASIDLGAMAGGRA